MNFEDKVIITVISGIVLAVFLDLQAKKQYQHVKNNIKKVSIEELLEDKKIHKAKEQIEEVYEENKEKVIESAKKIPQKIENSYLKNLESLTLPYNDAEITEINLYFPRFLKNKKTEMYQVSRKIKGKVNPITALNTLQKGPLEKESGLVNAYYEGVSFYKISYDEEKQILHLFFDQSFYSHNDVIMKDRIDQICLTLKQFPEIRSIYYWIENQLYLKQEKCEKKVIKYKEETKIKEN